MQNFEEALPRFLDVLGVPHTPSLGTSGQSRVTAFTRRANALRAVRKKLDEEVARLYFESLHQRNEALPFYQLPPEIQAHILQLALEMDHITISSHYYERLHCYAQVSSLWKSLVLDTPIFWNKIYESMEPRLRDIALARSKDCPLEVQSQRAVFGSIRHDGASFWRNIARTIGRWDSIDILLDVGGPVNSVLPVLERPAPNLRVAQISRTSYMPYFRGSNFQPVDLFAGQAERLNRLSIVDIPIIWDSQVLLGLQVLSLSSIRHHGPKWSQLFHFLRNASSLVSLTLQDVNVSHLTATRSLEDPLELPSLRAMKLSGMDPRFVHNVLEAFRISNATVLDFKINMKNSSFREVVDNETDHMLPTFRNLLHSSMDVLISLNYQYCSILSSDDQANFILRLELIHETDYSSFCNWITRLGVNDLPVPLSLSLGPFESFAAPLASGATMNTLIGGIDPFERILPSATWDVIKNAIRSLPSASNLSLELDDISIDPLLEFLAQPRNQAASLVEWPLPQLRDLSSSGGSLSLRHLLTMLLYRCGKSSSINDRQEPSTLPSRIERIQITRGIIRDESEDISEEIKELIEPGTLSYPSSHGRRHGLFSDYSDNEDESDYYHDGSTDDDDWAGYSP